MSPDFTDCCNELHVIFSPENLPEVAAAVCRQEASIRLITIPAANQHYEIFPISRCETSTTSASVCKA